jgi:hypothetical protein
VQRIPARLAGFTRRMTKTMVPSSIDETMIVVEDQISTLGRFYFSISFLSSSFCGGGGEFRV